MMVWTVESIQKLPEFGSNSRAGWFYGLVADKHDDEDCLFLAEIIPGMGYTFVDASEINADTSRMIVQDLARDLPPETSATASITKDGQ